MSSEEVNEFMEECSKLLGEMMTLSQEEVPLLLHSRPDADETLHKWTSEIDELRHLLHWQWIEMAELFRN